MYAFIRWKRCQLESTWKIKIAFLLNSFSSVSVSCCAENTIASEIQNRENCISNRADDRGWMSQLQLLHLEWQFHLYATHMFTVTHPMVCNFVMPEANLFQKLFCGTQKGKTETEMTKFHGDDNECFYSARFVIVPQCCWNTNTQPLNKIWFILHLVRGLI